MKDMSFGGPGIRNGKGHGSEGNPAGVLTGGLHHIFDGFIGGIGPRIHPIEILSKPANVVKVFEGIVGYLLEQGYDAHHRNA